MDPWSLLAIAAVVASGAYAVLRKGLLSLALAIALLALYVLEVVSALATFGFASPVRSPVVEDLALVGPLGASAPWTWLTFQFVHASESHLLLNLLGIVFISPVFEERIGSARWAILYLAGGAFGALVFLLLHPKGIALIGASASVIAVFAAYARLHPRDKVRLFLPIPGIPALPVIYVVVGFLLVETVLSFVGPPGIAWEAHVGGAIFGFVLAPAVARLPFGRVRQGRLAPLDGLRALATTRELQAILAEAEKADLPEIRDAWIEKFAKAAVCPRCGGSLRPRFGRLTSGCGWRTKIG